MPARSCDRRATTCIPCDLVRLGDWGTGILKGFVSTICVPSGISGSGDADASVLEYGGGAGEGGR